VNIKIAGKWMFIPLKMVLIGIDPYPNSFHASSSKIWGNLLKSVAGTKSGRPVQDKQSLISSSHGRKNQPGVIFVM